MQASPSATIGDWAKASDWARDTGGERDADGAPVRALDGEWQALWVEATTSDDNNDGAQPLRRTASVWVADGQQQLTPTSSGEELLARFEQEWGVKQTRRTRFDSHFTDVSAEPEPEPQPEAEPELEPEPEPV